MRWAEKKRREFICGFIAEHGYINRADIMREFGISVPQASKDLQKLIAEFPELLTYNTKAKRYEVKEIGTQEN